MQHWIHNIAELVSLIITIIYYPYLKGTVFKWFLPFLLVIFLGEIFAKYQIYVLKTTTLKTYYLIVIVETIFYPYIFFGLCNYNLIKKVIAATIFVGLLIYFISFFASSSFIESFYFNITIAGILLTIVPLLYVYSAIIADEIHKLTLEPGFWLAFGVAMFFSGSTIVVSLHNFMAPRHLVFFGQNLHNIIPRVLSVFLYLSISISIILCKKKTRISYSPS